MLAERFTIVAPLSPPLESGASSRRIRSVPNVEPPGAAVGQGQAKGHRQRGLMRVITLSEKERTLTVRKPTEVL